MKGRKPKPAAFMSYARLDDDRFRRLTLFREDLSAEVQRQIGGEFPIFQDREDIRWGQNWKKRIEESIDEVTFLIPIITPSFFRSPYCRDELQRFIEHEKKLKRNDLILPVYYVSCDADTWAGDNLAQVIAEHACADWRKLRSKSVDSEEVHKALIERAEHIRDAWKHVQASENREVPESDAGVTRRPSAKTDPLTRVVDQMHRGDHVTITEAIEAANPGDRILVRPGTYHEGLVIDKPGLEIIGDGNLDDVVVHAVGMDAIVFLTTMGRVVNLALRQMGGRQYGVNIVKGRLELVECDITSNGTAGGTIHSGADPRLRRNRIHDGGQGVLEDNDIFENGFAGVEIVGGNPIMRRNRINKNGYWAVSVHHGGGGTIEDNDLRDNAKGAWNISPDSEPNLRRARNKE